MDFSDIKLVVSDMDGTLLNSNHQVSTRFFELFRELRAHNVMFAAASGRQYNSIVDKLQLIKDDIIVIAENGGFAMEKKNLLVSTPLDNTIGAAIFEALKAVPDIHPVICTKHKAFLSNDSKAFLEKLQEYYTAFEFLDDLNSYQGEIMKIAVYHPESSEQYIYPAVRHLESALKVKVSGANWVDLSHNNAHKGHALKIIQKLYNIKPAETMVFGDYNNDLEMMRLSNFSYAMANAHPNIIKAANFSTSSNDEQGVEQILERVLKSKS